MLHFLSNMFIHMVVIFNNKHHGNNISQHYNNIAYISRLGYVLLQYEGNIFSIMEFN
jgi:hypothetical protein